MNFSNIDFDRLLKNGVQFGFGVLKKNVEKAVSDNALKLVKNAVFGKSGQNVRNNNIRLKAGDSVTFVVTKTGLKNVEKSDEQSLVENEHTIDSQCPTCAKLWDAVGEGICADQHILCDSCLKSQLKSKL